MAEIRSRMDNLLAANTEFAKSFTPPPTMPQLRENEGDRVFVVTCMDPRVVPEQFLGPNAFPAVFRNGGGRCTPDVVRSITVLRSLAYKPGKLTVMVVHHTDCGATHLSNESVRADVIARDPSHAELVKDTDFRLFTTQDLDKAVFEDMDFLKASEFLHGVEVRGFVLDLETGLLRELEA